ncbi:MAG TPA: alpha/beta fold hydrolase [Gammaproteobacteria bacterium]|nr:alpha/beta fold hydrolase [Gammaproteobacteria bacterium]
MPYHEPKNEIIILMHGLMRTHRSMRFLEKYLNKNGYETYNYNYPSTQFTIEEHGAHLNNYIANLLLTHPNKNLNFITHSLGGIIARKALSQLSQQNLDRCNSLIMLAPPNKGSLFAKLALAIAPFLSLWIKPLAELSCNPDAYVHQVPVPDQIKIGTIAGRFDIKAPPAVTHLVQQSDFLMVNSAHTFIMNHPKARTAILNFLQQGKFYLIE